MKFCMLLTLLTCLIIQGCEATTSAELREALQELLTEVEAEKRADATAPTDSSDPPDGSDGNAADDSPPAETLSCPLAEGQRPYSISVTSVAVSGFRVDRTTRPPSPFTEEQWQYNDYNFNVTASVTYSVSTQNFCHEDPFRWQECKWPSFVPVVVWHEGDGDTGNFSTRSTSRSVSDDELSTTVSGTNPAVIPHVLVYAALQTLDGSFRFDQIYTQYNFKDNSWEKHYPPITFHCYPPSTVRVEEHTDVVLFWSFTIKPALNSTKEELLKHTIRFRGKLLEYSDLYWNKLEWSERIGRINLEPTSTWLSGTQHHWYPDPGRVIGEVMEQDDGYKVNLQMEFPADNVERWLQGFYEMDFGSIKSVTKLHIDPSDVDNTTREYYHQRNCAFGFDQLNVNLFKGGTRYEYQRYLELRPRVESPNSASEITCKAYGCDVEAVELLKDGRPVPTRYQPQRSDSVVQSVAGGYTTISHLLTHINDSTYGRYECRASDRTQNVSTSSQVHVIAAVQVKAKVLGWNQTHTVIACRGSGLPAPSVVFYNGSSLLRFEAQETKTFWTDWGSPFAFNEPIGWVNEAITTIGIGGDDLNRQTVTCKAHSVYVGEKTAPLELRKYSRSDEEMRTWDRACC